MRQLLLLSIVLFTLSVQAGNLPFRTIRVTVQPELMKSFIPGGRLLIHLSRQHAREPRFQSEMTIGITPSGWNGAATWQFDSSGEGFLTAGPENWPLDAGGKTYCQAIYKQNPDDAQENTTRNLVSSIDSSLSATSGVLQLTLRQVIPQVTLAENRFVRFVEIKSDLLSAFSGHPRYLKASVLLPSGWFDHPGDTYPICYRAPGLNGRFTSVDRLMKDSDFHDWWFSGTAPQIIYVFLDSQGPYGDTYQIDSENNGPCGQALLKELIPVIEKMARYDPSSGMRYLTGCSTGGWVSLGLQVLYPDFFDGTWSYSPDPVDFEHYGLINIYQDETIFYNRYGFLQPGTRTIYGEPVRSMKDWIHAENVVSRTGNYLVSGGQFGAYNAVFGPRGKDGLPTLMFDPFTGKIDHEIARQWEKYDIKKILEKNWPVLGPKLQGKIWIWTGDMDGLYSNVATRFLKMFLDKTENPKSDARINFTPMAGHCEEWDDKIALQMITARAAEKQKLKSK